MKVEFISSVAVIVRDPAASRQLFVDAFALPLERMGKTDYFASEKIGGSKHFGVWPLVEAAQACFGSSTWPADRPVPQVSIELEVAAEAEVERAAGELEQRGYTLLHRTRKEPWGQTVARLQTTDGAIVGVSYAPWMH
jgi:catechol 2,3-dioxygenase-like lactoylglutathione lyase family enzyme